MAAKRKRTVPPLLYVSEQERALIHAKMEQYGTSNLSAYLRKMAFDGYVVNLDLPELRELVALLRRSSNNLNQLTRCANGMGFDSVASRIDSLLALTLDLLSKFRM